MKEGFAAVVTCVELESFTDAYGAMAVSQEEQWEALALAMVGALSKNRLPDLQTSLSSSEVLAGLGTSVEELNELVALLLNPSED